MTFTVEQLTFLSRLANFIIIESECVGHATSRPHDETTKSNASSRRNWKPKQRERYNARKDFSKSLGFEKKGSSQLYSQVLILSCMSHMLWLVSYC